MTFKFGLDPFECRYIFTADGKYLLGGMMVGDTSDYVKLVSIVKKKVQAPEFPRDPLTDFLFPEIARGTSG